MKRAIVIICIVLILAAGIAACLLPRQTTFDGTFHGMQLSADGTALEECDIVLKYTKLDYLFKEDTYKFIELSLPNYHCDTSDYQTNIPFTKNTDLGCERISLMEYNAESNAYSDQIVINLDLDQDWCFVNLFIGSHQNEYFFIGAADDSVDLQQILDSFIKFGITSA